MLKIQQGFPDMLVKLRGRRQPVHLELELYSSSFLLHRHDHCVRAKCFRGVPVAVLCWVDDDHGRKLCRCVDHVFALQDLLREGRIVRF